MGKRFDQLSDEHIAFIAKQPLFFVGTALQEGTINISPKGMDSFRVIDHATVVWLNLTGSGNETATHIDLNGRMTILFCAFEGKPYILRLYGHAKVYYNGSSEFAQWNTHFPTLPGARQIFEMKIDLVQKSCGFAVPLMDFQQQRSTLHDWALKQGPKKIHDYWEKRNSISLDGLETGIVEKTNEVHGNG